MTLTTPFSNLLRHLEGSVRLILVVELSQQLFPSLHPMANPTENLDPNPPTREPEDEVEELNGDEGEVEEEEEDDDEGEDDDAVSNPQSLKTESLFRRMRSAPVPVRVHDVIVKGNTKTKDHIIEAEVDGVREASTLQELLEASRVANSNLRALDVFDSVNVTLDSGPPELPGTTNVIIEVVESKSPLTGQIGAYTRAEVLALIATIQLSWFC